jgi:hypothetical protein
MISLVLALFMVRSVVLAQTFPLTVKAYWTPSVVDATHAAPDNYILIVDGGTPVVVSATTINDVNCPLATNPMGCIFTTATIAAAGQHTFCASAVNAWGSSAPVCVTANVSTPGNIVWVKVTK